MLTSVLAILGYIWILSIRKLATELYVNDLGLKGKKNFPLQISSGILNFVYKTVEDKIYQTDDKEQQYAALHDVLENDLGSEAYIIPFKDPDSGYEGKNVISYIRSPRGMGNQCNLMAFPINDIESLKIGVGFVYHMKELNPGFLHKDLIFLFYESTSYSLGTKNFIRQWLSGNQVIKGRCGNIRHAFMMSEFKDHGKVVSVVSEGKNYNMNDQNLLYITRSAFEQTKLKYDLNFPYSFTKNKFWKNLLSDTKGIREGIDFYGKSIFDGIKEAGIDIPYADLSSPTFHLDSLKNHLFGNLHLPHNDFLDYGIYSLTFIPYHTGHSKILESYISLLETIIIKLDEVDTHIHSGTTQYFYGDDNNIITLQHFPYPILLF